MTQYTLLNPLTGASKTLSKTFLTRSLELNVILLRGDEHVGIITHRDLVTFLRWCADQVLSRCQTVPPETRTALDLVDKWLVDPGSVSNEVLWAAADAVGPERVGGGASWTAQAAAKAAKAAGTAAKAAAWAARDVANAAAQAADAAWAADDARAAADAVGPARAAAWTAQVEVSYEAQAQWLVEHLRSAQ